MSRHFPGKALLLVILLLPVVAGCMPAMAQQPTPAPPSGGDRTLTVLGHGSASGQPDLAIATLGVQTQAATAGEATRQNSARMDAVLARLRELGIAEQDIRTTSFSLTTVPAPDGSRPSGGYQVSNLVQVNVRDLSRLGAILDAAIAAGANQVAGVALSIADPDTLETQARQQAVADAQARAQSLAQLAGVTLGPILSISESSTPSPLPQRAATGGAQEAPPISPGELQVTSDVQVTYRLQ